jgi:putative transcriptional regulator
MKNLVRTLRTERNLAQGALADAMGVSRQTINSIENERYTPSLPLAMALARYFGVTVEEMFDDQGLYAPSGTSPGRSGPLRGQSG